MGDLCRGAALESPIRRHGTLCAAFPLIVIYVDMAPLVPLRGAKARDYNMFSTVPGFRFLASLSRRVPPAVPRAGGSVGVAAPRRTDRTTGVVAVALRRDPCPARARAPRRPRRARPPHGAPTCPARPTGRTGPRVAGDRPLHCPSPPSRESGRIRELNSEAGAAPPVRIHHHLVTESKGGGDCV